MELNVDELRKAIEDLQMEVERLKSREQAVLEDEERYRLLTQNSLTGIYIHQDGRFVFVNKRFAEILECRPEDVVGREIWDFIHPDDHALVKSTAVVQQPSEETVPALEFRVVTKQGRTRWVEVWAAKVKYRGKTAYMGNVADITDRKNDLTELAKRIRTIDDLYEHLVQSGKAKAIAEHTAVVAHELRQPLTVIGGFVRRLEKECEPSQLRKDPVHLDLFPIVVNEVRRLEQILARLLDFSGRDGLKLQPVNPHNLIRYVLRISEVMMQEKDLTLDLHFGENMREIALDQVRFQQVVRDLVTNAIEASVKGGVISVQTSLYQPNEKTRQTGGLEFDTYFELKIQNHGEKIQPDVLDQIFNPFFTTKESGTGLGLPLSRKIIAEHRGSISVKSDAEGTVCTVWLPAK